MQKHWAIFLGMLKKVVVLAENVKKLITTHPQKSAHSHGPKM